MSAADWATVLLAVFGFIGIVVGASSWVYRRGGQERSLVNAVERQEKALDANTKATTELTVHMVRIGDAVAAHGERLADHETRLRAGGL